jgi:hypothetical protein
MIQLSREQKTIENYMSFSNDVLGILALSLGASCLGFKHPQPFACFFLFVVLLWLVSKQSPLTLKHFRRYKTFMDNVQLMWDLKIYLIGCMFLGSIALGITTQESIYTLLGYAT